MVDGTLAGYSAERRPVGARVIRQTRALTRLFTVRNPPGRWLRDQLFARVIDPSPALQRALARRIMGLA
jgi:2-polyprenyl-6-methoxyphenol hydroxylase-like FAD-dependent oxidoreductase